MLSHIFIWILENRIELSGAILGIIYIFFSIKQHILTWPIGLLTSILYVIVFFRAGFYADMGLQGYYVIISIYGWYYWLTGNKAKQQIKNEQISVTNIPKFILFVSIPVTLIIFFILYFILNHFTNSTIPYMDSLTTALSITATWMLARKYIEHWLIWIFVDLFSTGLYIYKNLWPTVILFVVYTVMAILGYIEWNKSLNKIENTN